MLGSWHVKIKLLLLLPIVCWQVSAQGRFFTVQLEAFASQEVAEKRAGELRGAGIEAYLVRSELPGRGVLFRVRVGRFSTSAAARRLGEDLRVRQLTADFFVTAWEAPFTPASPPVNAPVSAPVNAVAAPRTEPRPPAESVRPAITSPPTTRGNVAEAAESRVNGVESPITAAPAPTRLAANRPVTAEPPPSRPEPRSFIRFSDQAIGYAFDRPQTWEGGLLASRDMADQNINAGALFRSSPDRAFLNVIWNKLDQANSPDHDNDLIVELILRSMSSGEGTKQMKEVARRVVTENGQIKTYLDLQAKFELPGGNSILDFSGKGIIVRNTQGILLVVTFYSTAGPSDIPAVADHILASVTLP